MSQNEEPPPSDPSALEKRLDLVVTQAAPRKSKAFLMVSAGEAAGTVFPLTHSSLLIGRSADAEVRINENAVSNEHARVELSGSRYVIRDLGSTNGTYVNGQSISGGVPLAGGDTIRTGSTTFTFVTREGSMPAATVKLDGFAGDPSVGTRLSAPPPAARTRLVPVDDRDSEDSLSLTDVIHKVRTYWVFVRRYSWLAMTCMIFGVAVGMLQARLNPPPASAWFEMTLKGEGRSAEDEGSLESFVAAESTFRSLPLIKATLGELGAINVSDAAASDIQAALSFERKGYTANVWRGDYQDATPELAVAFLRKHVEVYVGSEIDKIVKVLKADAEFDRQQETAADERVTEARNRLIEFIDEHPDAVPKDAKLPSRPLVRLAPDASPERIQRAIASTQRALAGAYSSIQTKKARPYLDQAAQAEGKIAEAKSRGLGDRHPEVKNLVALAAGMRAKAMQLLRAEPNEAEQSLDGEVVRLKQELFELNKRLQQASPARAVAGDAPLVGASGSDAAATSARDAREPAAPQSLSQLKLQYAELAREYERAKTDHEALLKKRDTTDRQLERERTSAQARYDIITPPTAEAPRSALVLFKRGSFGGIIGLGLALVAAACLELRRMLIARGHL